MISVAMTTYNSLRHPEYLQAQLDSIRRQTKSVDEVIIVDDASGDHTCAYVTAYIEKYGLNDQWHLYRNESNSGFIRSFSRALSLTNGDIVLLCDHDDIWLPDKVEVIDRTFQNHPDILSLNTSFTNIDENGNLLPSENSPGKANNGLIRRRIKKGKLNQMRLEDVLVYNISPGCTCAVQRKLIDLYLERDYQLPHDWKLNVLAALNNGLYYLDVVTTYYRIYQDNTIGLGHESNYIKRNRIVRNNCLEKKEIVRLLEDYHADSESIKEAKDICDIFRMRSNMLEQGKIFPDGIRCFLRSLKYGFLFESVLMDEKTILTKNH